MGRRIDNGLPVDELRRLRFREPRETQFRHFYFAVYASKAVRYLLFGLLLFVLFAIADWLLLGAHLYSVLAVRLAVATLLLVMLHCSTRPWGRPFIMPLESFGLLLINGAIIYIGLLAARDGVPEYQSGTLLVVLFAATLSRLTFRYSLLTIALALLSYSLLLLVPEAQATRSVTINNLAICLAVTVLALITCYQREYDSRRDFFTTRLLEEQTQQLQVAQARLTWLAQRDSLTELYNRRYFDEQFASHSQLCARAGAPLALLLVDVDHFKAYNDGFGHQAGDDTLRQVARLLAAMARRKEDFAARIGGEEFALLLPVMSQEGAMRLAEQLRRRIEELALPHPRGGVVTISIGVACQPETSEPLSAEAPAALLALADQGLYQAKAAGRNRVVDAGYLSLQRVGRGE